jgi:outer membrane receptor for monomeric catechols
MMYHIPGVLSPKDVARFREQLEQAEWVDGRVTTGAQGAQVKNNQQVDTTIRNTTRWSRVKQDYLMTAIMGGASNITQPTSDVNSWTWSRTANTKDVSNKILTNQTNLTSTFYTGSIGHDVSTGVEFTRETQTNYGVYPEPAIWCQSRWCWLFAV